MTSDFLKNYDISEKTLRGLYDSRLRLAILDALKDKPLRLSDLRREVGANAPNTSAKAKELEEMGIIERIEGDFQLTPYGQTVRNRIKESLEFYATYQKFKEFWETHRTDGIPPELWAKIGELNNSVLVRDITTNVTESYDKFVKLLRSIREKFYGISLIYHNEYMAEVFSKLDANVDSKFIVSKEIFDLIVSLPAKDRKVLRSIGDRGEWFIYEKHLTVAYTVSESFSSLALETKGDPSHYLNMDLQSMDPRAIKWGLDLFEYYRKNSKKVKLSDYL